MDSLRLSRRDMQRLGLVLALSLLLHLMGWGGYEAGKEFGWWQQWHWPKWLPRLTILNIKPPPPQNNEQQLVFVEVSQPSAEAPKDTKYYSSKNSRAGDPTQGDKDVPQLNGKQTEIVKTENVPRPTVSKLQPAPPTPQKPAPSVVQPKPLVSKPGDLTLGKPETWDKPTPQEEPRPRTVKQALAQQSQRLPGPQMRQEGGMQRHLEVASLDARSTSFGAYDDALIDAVTQSWFNLLDQTRYASDSHGKVVIQFNLHSDGSVTDLKIAGDTADDVPGGIWAIVCQSAIDKAAPFARWPSDMYHEIGSTTRPVRFTFYY